MIDTSKLSRALRVGGAGLEVRSEVGYNDRRYTRVYLPTGQKVNGWPPGITTEQLIESVRRDPRYQDWLKRAKCEHGAFVAISYIGQSFPPPDCKKCGAKKADVDAGHYTLLPEPADGVCAMHGCKKLTRTGRRERTPQDVGCGWTLCSDHARDFMADPDCPMLDYRKMTTDQADEAVRAWAARQSKKWTLENGDWVGAGPESVEITTFAELDAHCRACEKDRWLPWKGMRVEAGRTATGYEVRVVDHGNPDTENFHCSAIEVHLPTSKDDLTFWIFGQMQALFNARDRQNKKESTRKIRKREGLSAKCKECSAPNADVLKQLCIYCERRLNSIESARADLDRPLPERIDLARQELGFHDGYGAYSLPGEPK